MNAEELRDLLLNETNVLLYGPPGTGKTHLVQQVATLLTGAETAASSIVLDTDLEQQFLQLRQALRCKVFWVTFHQSYSYDNFVVGLRPDLDSDRLLALKPEPGVLLHAAAYAALPGNASLIVIDEINRGNVGQIFGDFITIIEPGKRLDEDGSATGETVRVTLPYVGQGDSIQIEMEGSIGTIENPFSLPRRVFTLATMNSVDRTAAPLDAAIRRRFRVVNLSVDREAIAAALGLESASVNIDDANLQNVHGVKVLAAYLLDEVNTRIEWFLGPDFQLGQWYLGPLGSVEQVDEALNALANVWAGRIWPQLEETFALRSDQLVALLRLDRLGTNEVLSLSSPDENALGAGASPTPRFKSSADAESVGRALLAIARGLRD